MKTSLSPQQLRLVVLVGLLFLFVVGGGMFVLGQKQQSSTPAAPLPVQRTSSTATPATANRSRAANAQPTAKPRMHAHRAVRLATHGLPVAVAKALRRHRVVVVSLVTPGVDVDGLARDEAAAAAHSTHAGFISLNVFKQRNGGPLLKKLGVVEAPATLVVMRPARIFAQLDGFADRDIVQQAVANARR